MPVLKQTVFRMVCKVHLEGRGERHRPRFGRERAYTFSLKLHLLPSGLCLLFLMIDAKNLDVCTFKEDERACIRGLLSD
jgi:hypothetical protein